jgi:quercetin dioxygenase-like cupin family protein
MEFFWSYIPPGADNGRTPASHVGEECIVVVKGALEFFFGGEAHLLQEGDAVYFDASVPHGWRNTGKDEVQLIWAATPPHL